MASWNNLLFPAPFFIDPHTQHTVELISATLFHTILMPVWSSKRRKATTLVGTPLDYKQCWIQISRYNRSLQRSQSSKDSWRSNYSSDLAVVNGTLDPNESRLKKSNSFFACGTTIQWYLFNLVLIVSNVKRVSIFSNQLFQNDLCAPWYSYLVRNCLCRFEGWRWSVLETKLVLHLH